MSRVIHQNSREAQFVKVYLAFKKAVMQVLQVLQKHYEKYISVFSCELQVHNLVVLYKFLMLYVTL